MSPEQASGTRELDARTDVYALGCVLYEMLAGEPPYTGPTTQAIIARALTETPRPIHPMRAGVPEALDTVIAKAMAATPADRYANPGELARTLAAIQRSTASIGERDLWGETRGHAWLARRPVFAALFLGALLGVGALFAWRRTHGVERGATKLVAVLPFENLGSSEDEYFADGITDEVRGKLSTLPGLRVIARGSSTPYKKTTKSPQQIGQELGAQYLLTATVRWEKLPDGASRVHVTPELVEGSSPTTKWQAPFDAALTDVFQVQADIAGRVAQALDVALGDSTRRQLATKPTQNLAAYDAFLRGEAASQGMSAIDSPSLRQAIAAYEQAVALDSSFALAWAQLARAHASLYLIGFGSAGREAARHAAERALSLAPTRPEGHQALAAYYSYVPPRDQPRAYAEDSTALALAPGNAGLLGAVGWDEFRLGRWEAARGHLEQAVQLDPRSGATADQLGQLLLYLRQYPEAQQALDRALQLLPANLLVRADRATVALAHGDLARAQAIINAAPKEVNPTALVAFVANYSDLMWVLDEAQQQLLLRLTPSAFDDSRSLWGIVRAQTYALRGNSARARVYADSARLDFERALQASPQDAQLHVFLGLALAYLGDKTAAIREGMRGVTLMQISRDAWLGPYIQHQLARIYILVGEPEKALDQLEPLLKIPCYLSPGWLRIDPNFDPLRSNPRFQRLVAGGT